MATPGVVMRALASDWSLTGPRYSATSSILIVAFWIFPLGDTGGYAPADVGDLTLQIAQAGLAGIAGDDVPDRAGGEIDLLGIQAVGIPLAGNQIARWRS